MDIKEEYCPKERRIVKEELKDASAFRVLPLHQVICFKQIRISELQINGTRLDVGVAEKLLQPSYINGSRRERLRSGFEPVASVLELLRLRCDTCKYRTAKDEKPKSKGGESLSDALVCTYFIKTGTRSRSASLLMLSDGVKRWLTICPQRRVCFTTRHLLARPNFISAFMRSESTENGLEIRMSCVHT